MYSVENHLKMPPIDDQMGHAMAPKTLNRGLGYMSMDSSNPYTGGPSMPKDKNSPVVKY